MKTTTETSDPVVGYTWGRSEGTYFLRNHDGDFRKMSDDAMKLVRMLSEGEVSKSDLPDGALNLVETLENEEYLDSNSSVERICTPEDIRLWPRSMVFVVLTGTVLQLALPEISSLSNLSGLFDPLAFGTLLGLTLGSLAFHELGHYLTARRHVDTEFKIGTINGLVPAVMINTDDAWVLPKNRRRWISLGGPFAELCWLLGLVSVHRFVFTRSLVLSIVISFLMIQFAYNLVPILHGDGYWLLVDTFELGNLRKRGRRQLRRRNVSWAAAYVFTSYLFGVLVFVGFVIWAYYWFGVLGIAPFFIFVVATFFTRDYFQRVRRIFQRFHRSR